LPQALAAGALEAVPDEVTLTGYLESYTARLAPGDLAYYINDRFLLSIPDELADSLITLFANSSGPDYNLLIVPSPNLVSKNNSDTALGTVIPGMCGFGPSGLALLAELLWTVKFKSKV